MSINRVAISGNLTRDPEVRMTTSGTQVMNFGMAVNDRRRNPQTGEWEDRANFVECVVFGARAEGLARVLKKGFKVFVEGKLRQSTWETEDHQRRSAIEVVIDNIDFASRTTAPAPQQRQTTAPMPSYGGGVPQPEEIPF